MLFLIIHPIITTAILFHRLPSNPAFLRCNFSTTWPYLEFSTCHRFLIYVVKDLLCRKFLLLPEDLNSIQLRIGLNRLCRIKIPRIIIWNMWIQYLTREAEILQHRLSLLEHGTINFEDIGWTLSTSEKARYIFYTI